MNRKEHEQIKDALKEVLAYLKSEYPLESIPLLHEQRVIVEGSSVSIYTEPKLILERFLRGVPFPSLIDEGKLPKTKNAIIELDGKAEFRSRVASGKNRAQLSEKMNGPAFGNVVGIFLNNHVHIAKNFEFDETLFDQIWDEFISVKTKENIALVSVPLIGFIKQSNLALPDGLYIEELEEEDYIKIYQTDRNSDFIETKFKICKTFSYQGELDSLEAERKSLPARLAAIDAVKKFITALRLSGEGRFLPERLFYSKVPRNPQIRFNDFQSASYNIELFAIRHIRHPYALTDEIATKASEVYLKMTNPELQLVLHPLAIAATKFNESYSRVNREDKILDFASILDSLILHGNQTSNFYKLSLRCALLVRNRMSFSAFKFSDHLFSCRNDIIHMSHTVEEYAKGEKHLTIDGVLMSINDFVDNAEDLVRTVINEYLKRITPQINVGTVNTNLEDELVKYLKLHPDFKRNVKVGK